MAFTYETRKKMTEDWVRQTAARAGRLTEREKSLLPEEYAYSTYEVARRTPEATVIVIRFGIVLACKLQI